MHELVSLNEATSLKALVNYYKHNNQEMCFDADGWLAGWLADPVMDSKSQSIRQFQMGEDRSPFFVCLFRALHLVFNGSPCTNNLSLKEKRCQTPN